MKNILFLLLILIHAETWASEFSETYDVSARGFSREADSVVVYHQLNVAFDLDYQTKELDGLTARFSALEKIHKSDPIFVFVKGLHARNMASLMQRLGNIDDVHKWLNKKNALFLQTMALDNIESSKLSAAIYATIKKSLPEEHKQKAIAAELKLGGNGENDAYYWYLHWSNINQLQKQGKVEEAELALQKMNDELAKQETDVAAYSQISKQATQELNIRKQALAEAAEKSLVTKPIKQDLNAPVEDDNFYLYIVFIVMVIILLLIFAVAVYMYDKRKSR